MKRRDFIKYLCALSASASIPWQIKNALASTAPKLAIPNLLLPDQNGNINLEISEGKSQWNNSPTTTWGYNGSLLGPAILAQRGQNLNINVSNKLNESTAVHWHGVEVPGTSDGGPQETIEAGEIWNTKFQVMQAASSCWFHPHPHGKTGRHVAMGLGGLFLIEDEESAKLPIPKDWGKDDIPLIIQDKKLGKDAQIDYEINMMTAAVGWFGDFMISNGAIYPEHNAPKGWIRLRLLNACNARSLNLACSDNRPLYIIASDGGFLEEAVKVDSLRVYNGERFEVLIDFSDGKEFDLLSLPVRQMGMTLPPFDEALPILHIKSNEEKGTSRLPDSLIKLPAIPDLSEIPIRKLHLSMDPRLDMMGMQKLMDTYGEKAMAGMSMEGHSNMQANGQGGHMEAPNGSHDMGMMNMDMMNMGKEQKAMPKEPFDIWKSNFINDKAFSMNTASFNVKKGQYERWIISGVGDMMLHPFHIHGTQFRILRENDAKPELHRRGLKDTVFVEGKESEVLVRFMHEAPKERMYMAHCHLLEHEDTGMMLSFTVSK